MEQNNQKRVYTLYRVSTIGQVEKDDIPMQKEYCHAFIQEKGWTLVREFSEKGVSGFKVSANDRDAIMEIRKAPWRENSISCLSLCSTASDAGMTRRRS